MAVSSSEINLGWTDNSDNESGFEIDRATNASFSSDLVTTVAGSNSTSYHSTNLLASTVYYFRVRAVNSEGGSGYSNTASATTQASSGATMHVQSITTSAINAGQGKKRGQALITILDNQGAPVASATVSGIFSGTFNESVAGATVANGTVTIQTLATAKGTVTVNFCVTNVTHTSLTYDQAQNVITCTGAGNRMIGTDITHKGFTIYPNPSANTLILKGVTPDIKSIIIYDIWGRKRLSASPNKQSSITIQIQKLQPGVYFLRAEGNKIVQASFVKAK